jgi:hypothetical protein
MGASILDFRFWIFDWAVCPTDVRLENPRSLPVPAFGATAVQSKIRNPNSKIGVRKPFKTVRSNKNP